MTIKAPVFQRDPKTGKQQANLGVYEFEQLPAMGDVVNIAHGKGRDGRSYRVRCIAHEPCGENEPLPSDRYRAFVYVEFIEDIQ